MRRIDPGGKLKLLLTLTAAAAAAATMAATSHARVTDYRTGLSHIRYANAYCESGGDPHNRRNSKYRGKWQFDQQTWNAFAPRAWRYHDPADAPEWVQDKAALAVTYDAWPRC